MTDKYKDPVNDKILKEISKKVAKFKKTKGRDETKERFDVCLTYYRIGLYAGMNIALKNLGREPL